MDAASGFIAEQANRFRQRLLQAREVAFVFRASSRQSADSVARAAVEGAEPAHARALASCSAVENEAACAFLLRERACSTSVMAQANHAFSARTRKRAVLIIAIGMNRRERIVLCCTGDDVPRAINAAEFGAHVVERCASVHDFVDRLLKNDGCRAVWEVERGSDCMIEQIAKRLADVTPRVRLLLRLDLSVAAARQLVLAAAHLPNSYLSFRNHDDLRTDLAQWLAERDDHGGSVRIVQYLGSICSGETRDVMLSAAATGRRRLSVEQLALICGVPIRTLEWRLRSAAAPTARRLIGMAVSLHSAWRLEQLRLGPKQAAGRAGFHSTAALASYLRRHTGMRLSELASEGAFDLLLHRVGETFATHG